MDVAFQPQLWVSATLHKPEVELLSNLLFLWFSSFLSLTMCIILTSPCSKPGTLRTSGLHSESNTQEEEGERGCPTGFGFSLRLSKESQPLFLTLIK